MGLVTHSGKMSKDKRDPLSKQKRTTLILSHMTIVEDDYDFKGQGNVTNINFHNPKRTSRTLSDQLGTRGNS